MNRLLTIVLALAMVGTFVQQASARFFLVISTVHVYRVSYPDPYEGRRIEIETRYRARIDQANDNYDTAVRQIKGEEYSEAKEQRLIDEQDDILAQNKEAAILERDQQIDNVYAYMRYDEARNLYTDVASIEIGEEPCQFICIDSIVQQEFVVVFYEPYHGCGRPCYGGWHYRERYHSHDFHTVVIRERERHDRAWSDYRQSRQNSRVISGENRHFMPPSRSVDNRRSGQDNRGRQGNDNGRPNGQTAGPRGRTGDQTGGRSTGKQTGRNGNDNPPNKGEHGLPNWPNSYQNKPSNGNGGSPKASPPKGNDTRNNGDRRPGGFGSGDNRRGNGGTTTQPRPPRDNNSHDTKPKDPPKRDPPPKNNNPPKSGGGDKNGKGKGKGG